LLIRAFSIICKIGSVSVIAKCNFSQNHIETWFILYIWVNTIAFQGLEFDKIVHELASKFHELASRTGLPNPCLSVSPDLLGLWTSSREFANSFKLFMQALCVTDRQMCTPQPLVPPCRPPTNHHQMSTSHHSHLHKPSTCMTIVDDWIIWYYIYIYIYIYVLS
jgi:hypothetical protein